MCVEQHSLARELTCSAALLLSVFIYCTEARRDSVRSAQAARDSGESERVSGESEMRTIQCGCDSAVGSALGCRARGRGFDPLSMMS